MSDAKNIVLNVNGIEVIYNHVILVLKGVSLQVPQGGIVAILGGNGAGKTTTLRAVSNLLKGERGEVTKGSIELRGERIENLSPADLVQRGVVQVMEGRHCFAHLTIEENLMTGSYTRKDKGEIAANLEKVYNYFPRLKTRRTSQAAYTSGGEQQMCAIGRALMANPKMVLLDEPSMGLAPQIVEEVFEIVKDLNTKEKVTFLLAEQNTNIAQRLLGPFGAAAGALDDRRLQRRAVDRELRDLLATALEAALALAQAEFAQLALRALQRFVGLERRWREAEGVVAHRRGLRPASACGACSSSRRGSSCARRRRRRGRTP